MLYIVYNSNGETDDILDLNDNEVYNFSKANPDKELIPYNDIAETDFMFDDGTDFESEVDY